MALKVLLLQARKPDDPVREQERRSFAERCGLETEQVTPFDLLQGAPSKAEVKRHDVLMIGGSGDYYVSKRDMPNMPGTCDLLRDLFGAGHPTFASCFGFQLLVEALGGKIIYDPDNVEVGSFEVTMTEAGQADDLFSYLPRTFMAQLGHKDRAIRLPEGHLNLAGSRRAPFQALRIPGQPVWATQFHPELDAAENRRRFLRYMDGYGGVMSDADRAAAMNRFHDSPEADQMLKRFIDLVSE